ncbi:glycoside hydrolase family 88 protein [Lacrimispora sp. BS-2]|uniref:Glycoside hydrolase family 88 protein n=1 Tax=Lacrimispora sp. BS-2 TaxID=3151850 RepID=A0AAU7PM72_9FIRM
MEKWLALLFQKMDIKFQAECERMGDKIPYRTIEGSYKTDYGETDIYWWTNGFWPGILWKMYHATGKDNYRKCAELAERKLDKALHDFMGLHHDIGFMWLHSAVADYRLTDSKESRTRGLLAANILAGRYNPAGKYIRAWNPECVEEGQDCTGWIIVDSMMNIPLLYWASKELKDPRFYYIAKAHADTVKRTLVRADGSCGHIACLNPDSGELTEIMAGQGYSAASSWSRGQSWILYGFALSYRYTKDPEYLDTAKRTAHYFISNISLTDYIPLCDFRQPKKPVYWDASAGLCAACGLLEIAEHVEEQEKRLYRSHAEQIVKAVSERCCDWNPENDSVVQNCKVDYHSTGNQQTDLIYADYFMAEAVLRLAEKDFLIW